MPINITMVQAVIFSDATHSDEHADDRFFNVPVRSAGPYRIATEIRNSGLDCFVLNFLFYFSLDEVERICKSLITKETLIVGFSTTFWFLPTNPTEYEHRKSILRIIVNRSREFPNLKLIIGGTSARDYADYFTADACFVGYAEPLLIEYVKCLIAKEDFRVVPNDVSLKNTPIYKYDQASHKFDFNSSVIRYEPNDFIANQESTVLEIARGCIFKCKFCAYPLNGKSKLDYIKEAEIIRNELINNYENYGITNYTFSDDTFNDSTEKIKFLHDIFTNLPFKLQFGTYLRLDLLHAHREQIPLLKEMGLVAPFFGIETLSKKAGSNIGKSMDPRKSTDLLYDLKVKHWGSRIKIMVGLITGIPGEDQESFDITKKWIADKDYCLVDRVRPAALGIPNPLTDRSIWRSEFQINASKYGFYWPDRNSSWKNLNSWTKTYDQAKQQASELAMIAADNYRHKYGWSIMSFPSWSNNQKSLNSLLDMDRQSYSNWFDNNLQSMTTNFINDYKFKVLSLT